MPRTSNKGEEILRFIYDYSREKSYPPTVRDIGTAVGLSSTSTVHAQLMNLEKKGMIEKDSAKTRAIKLTDAGYAKLVADGLVPEERASMGGVPANEGISEYLEVPILGRVAAGNPILAIEEVTDMLPLPMTFAKNKDLFVLTVSGESMIEAAILDGDYVIVQKQETARNGDIVVALVEDSATVKTFYKEDRHFRLQPENSTMEPIIVNEVLILGKVVGVFRQM